MGKLLKINVFKTCAPASDTTDFSWMFILE